MIELRDEIFKYAIVDIGANSVRMNIYDIRNDSGDYTISLSVRSMLGLAAYKKDGKLTPDGEGKLFAVLREFLSRANSVPCDAFQAFATASLRGLANADEIVKRIQNKLGFEIQILSGEEEASFDHVATLASFPDIGRSLLIDLGGGSTEFVLFDGEKLLYAESLPIGCVMLTKKFTNRTKKEPFPTEKELKQIENYVKSTLLATPALRESAASAILIGGTARAASKLHRSLPQQKDADFSFTAKDLQHVYALAKSDAKSGGKWLRTEVSDRVLSILPGLCAYRAIAETLHIDTFHVSKAGVREGYLQTYIKQNILKKSPEV